MPLTANVTDNIKELTEANKTKPASEQRSRKEILAIAYSATRTRKASNYPHWNSEHTTPVPKNHPKGKAKLPIRADMPANSN